MRSTMQITANNTILNLHKANARYNNVVNQIATGKKVNKPSDDALATTEGLRLSNVVARLEQYNRNITNTGYSFLNLSESALSSVNKLMTTAKSLAIESASDTTSSSMRSANAVELSSILQEIVTLANSQESSRYLFAGTETKTTPYEIVGTSYVYYTGNSEAITIQADTATTVQVNSTGEDVFGSMTSVLGTHDLNPCLNLGGAFATKLSCLNGGAGVPAGSINVKMGSMSEYYPNGVTIDLTGCDTLQDVANKIEAETLAASRAIDPKGTLTPPDSYLTSRYVKVALNEAGNGITLIETDEVWEATKDNPAKRPVDYPGFVNDRNAYLTVSEVGGGSVAGSLGIAGSTRYAVDPLNKSFTIPQAIVGGDLNPRLGNNTLLADLANYSDKAFSITNGSLPGATGVMEVDDAANDFTDWYLTGMSKGQNTGKSGELYVRVEETELGSGEYRINLYKNEKCTPDMMVAQGVYGTGLVELHEMNDSGVRGTVTMPPVANPAYIAPVTLQVKFDDSFSSTISLSAYEKETARLSSVDVTEEFRLRGMYPGGDPQNRSLEPCDYNGKFAMEVVNEGTAANPRVVVNVYNNEGFPRSLIATGSLEDNVSKGTVTLSGTGKFTDLEGSVYVDWTKNQEDDGTGALVDKEATIAYKMRATFATVEDLMNAVDSSNTYTTAQISADGNGVEIVSHLAGAHLMVTEEVANAVHYNDYGQLGEIDLYTVMNGYNTDQGGKIYSNITTTRENATATVDVGGVPTELPIYTTTVALHNLDPQAAGYDDEKNLVGSATLRAAYDAAAEQWYVKDEILGVWNPISLPQDTKLTIQQANHSGLTGTLELNSIRIPNGAVDTSVYYDVNAAAGQQYLSRAIVIDTAACGHNDVVSNSGTGAPFSYLETTAIKGVVPGVNADADGNQTLVTGYKVTNDAHAQLNGLNLTGVNAGNTDNGKLYAAVTYGVTGDDNNQVQQLNVAAVNRNLDYPHLSDCDANGKIYVEIDGGTVNFYNDAAGRTAENLVATGTLTGTTVTFSPVPYAGPLNAGTRSLAGTFQVPSGALANDNDIVIDLNQASVALYSDAAKTNLVATGTSDASGKVALAAVNGSGLSGSVTVPLQGGVTFDNAVVVDTTALEAVLYAGTDYSRPVAKGDVNNQAGGEIVLKAVNGSGISGRVTVNAVVDTTDRYKQVQNVTLNGIDVGGETDANGCVYAEVVADANGDWHVNFYSDAAGANLIASGLMEDNTGVVNITDGGTGSGVSGSLQLANPPTWLPTEQSLAAGNGMITIDVANQHSVTITQPTGLKNSGMKREDNVFATFTDTLAAMNNDDVAALHDLLDVFNRDSTRFLTARATIGTRVDRLQMLEERHSDEIYSFTTSYSNVIALDYTKAAVEKQNAENVYNAAMTVYANILQTSLVDFI